MLGLTRSCASTLPIHTRSRSPVCDAYQDIANWLDDASITEDSPHSAISSKLTTAFSNGSYNHHVAVELEGFEFLLRDNLCIDIPVNVTLRNCTANGHGVITFYKGELASRSHDITVLKRHAQSAN